VDRNLVGFGEMFYHCFLSIHLWKLFSSNNNLIFQCNLLNGILFGSKVAGSVTMCMPLKLYFLDMFFSYQLVLILQCFSSS
jgi:hypothetical protein